MYPACFGICRLRHFLLPVPEEVPVLPFAVLEEDAASLRLPEDAAFFRLPVVFLFLAELLELPAELEAPEELAASASALRRLGGRAGETRAFALPDGSARNLVVLKKISQTPPAYPRNGGKIAKKPL